MKNHPHSSYFCNCFHLLSVILEFKITAVFIVFEQVEGDLKGERIVRMSSRSDCVLALNDKGDLFAWGNNEYDQLLGVTQQMQLHTPKHIKLNRKLKDVAAGGSSCIALDGKF